MEANEQAEEALSEDEDGKSEPFLISGLGYGNLP